MRSKQTSAGRISVPVSGIWLSVAPMWLCSCSLFSPPPQPVPAPEAEVVAAPASQPVKPDLVPPSGQTKVILSGAEYGQVSQITKSIAVARPQIEIIGTKQTDSDDGQSTLIEGTLRNRGAAPTTQIQLKITGLDEADRAVVTTTALPTSQTIAPGDRTTFSARIGNGPTIRKFHIKAEIR